MVMIKCKSVIVFFCSKLPIGSKTRKTIKEEKKGSNFTLAITLCQYEQKSGTHTNSFTNFM